MAQVASYDVVANDADRFIVGLFGADRSRLVAYGTVTMSFAYLGTAEAPEPAGAGPPTVGPLEASFLPIPGQNVAAGTPGPQLVAGSVATGVYGVDSVSFDRAGFWEVQVSAVLDGQERKATAAFEVLAESAIPGPGDPAPRTEQPLAASSEVDPRSVDSRAGPGEPIPDPELHDITVADAIASGRPAMVVVSTPTFCTSRFCGPITEAVQDLARAHRPEMAFIHIEVWQDFEAGVVNPAAAEWIAPTPATDGREPWVFVIDRHGVIADRFDNVATEAELAAATEEVLSR